MSLGYAEYLIQLSWETRCGWPGCDCEKARDPDVWYEAMARLLAERGPA